MLDIFSLVGFACSSRGLSAPSHVCHAGYYCPQGQNSSQPVQYMCSPGHMCPPGSATQISCAPGSYQSLHTQVSIEIYGLTLQQELSTLAQVSSFPCSTSPDRVYIININDINYLISLILIMPFPKKIFKCVPYVELMLSFRDDLIKTILLCSFFISYF